MVEAELALVVDDELELSAYTPIPATATTMMITITIAVLAIAVLLSGLTITNRTQRSVSI